MPKYSATSLEENVHKSALLAAELDEALTSAEDAIRFDKDFQHSVDRIQKSADKD